MQCLSFSAWLISLSKLLLMAIHVSASGNISFCFMAEKYVILGFPGGPGSLAVKNLPANEEDEGVVGLIAGSERSPGVRMETHSILFPGNSMNRRA